MAIRSNKAELVGRVSSDKVELKGTIVANNTPIIVQMVGTGPQGRPGRPGDPGEPGYTPQKGIDYFDGEPGAPGYTPVKGVDYFDGRDGVDGTVSFDNLTPEQKASLKGDPGKDGYTPIKGIDYFDGEPGYTPQKGVDYFDGEPGHGFITVTSAPSSYTTPTGGITPSYRMALSTIKAQSTLDARVGDTLRYSYYTYGIIYIDDTYAYTSARASIRGKEGAAGTPGNDYVLTDADKAEIAEMAVALLPVYDGGVT